MGGKALGDGVRVPSGRVGFTAPSRVGGTSRRWYERTCEGQEGRGPIDSVLATLAALVVIGLLFALDPGGAIAESGFPDYREMDWTQLRAWGFRTIGVGVGLLLFLVLWLWPKYRPPQGTEAHWRSSYPATPQSGSLPAAAVSALEGHWI